MCTVRYNPTRPAAYYNSQITNPQEKQDISNQKKVPNKVEPKNTDTQESLKTNNPVKGTSNTNVSFVDNSQEKSKFLGELNSAFFEMENTIDPQKLNSLKEKINSAFENLPNDLKSDRELQSETANIHGYATLKSKGQLENPKEIKKTSSLDSIQKKDDMPNSLDIPVGKPKSKIVPKSSSSIGKTKKSTKKNKVSEPVNLEKSKKSTKSKLQNKSTINETAKVKNSSVCLPEKYKLK